MTKQIVPLEADKKNFDAYGNIDLAVLQSLRAKVKQAGLWVHKSQLSRVGLAMGQPVWLFYMTMNYSIFGPAAFNCAAPDDGNMYILNKVNQGAKDFWLQPIIR